MDRVRKALDLARLERAQAGTSARPERAVPAPEAPGERPAAGSSLTEILYSRTKVFAPPPAQLECNRIVDPASASPAAAAYRMLRTQVLQRMDANNWRILAIFSAGAEDGKTTTAINLAVSLGGDHSHTVLLVDLDFKRPRLASYFGLRPEFGVDDFLLGHAPLEDCLYHPEGFERLVLLPARAEIGNSSHMLSGPRSRELGGCGRGPHSTHRSGAHGRAAEKNPARGHRAQPGSGRAFGLLRAPPCTSATSASRANPSH